MGAAVLAALVALVMIRKKKKQETPDFPIESVNETLNTMEEEFDALSEYGLSPGIDQDSDGWGRSSAAIEIMDAESTGLMVSEYGFSGPGQHNEDEEVAPPRGCDDGSGDSLSLHEDKWSSSQDARE
jgi:hypothetical protein